ncbi:uncharacterized protein LOC106460583 [Limulus polyphemus]|uniref:Uncharacterized protein LOC106460583 n=1 Tax=Limulus polyphemus TaxID=6850 RepID=A0ABM1B6F4_LIMPO|nr:uncharacterized protein LOC106460583 [Limulus polyphemus]
MASKQGWGTDQKWKNLFDRLLHDENSTTHKNCYLAWHELERRLESDTGIDVMSHKVIMSETEKWRNILTRIIDVILFLGQIGLAFHGLSQRIGDIHNEHILGIIEFLSNYDPVLAEHVAKIRALQENGEWLQVHYLSGSSQIEFISNCADYVRRHIFDEIRATEYYSIMVDATSDSSHVEQTTFIIRYLAKDDTEFVVQERFLTFVDCCKTGLN